MRWAFRQTEVERATQARKLFSKTLPHFVGAAIIATQQIVCQEKNIILQIFSAPNLLRTGTKFRWDLKMGDNNRAFYSWTQWEEANIDERVSDQGLLACDSIAFHRSAGRCNPIDAAIAPACQQSAAD
jgi:hypothetical protein